VHVFAAWLCYFRNDYTATAIADYAVRARPGMPVEWREIKSLDSASQFPMKEVLKRLKGKRPDAGSVPGQRLPA
jgi:DNA primase